MNLFCALRGHAFGNWHETFKNERTGLAYPSIKIAIRKCQRCGFEDKALPKAQSALLRRIAIVTGHDRLYKLADQQYKKVRGTNGK